jgi:spore germination protein YaaH
MRYFEIFKNGLQRILRFGFAGTFLLAATANAAQPEALFYMTTESRSVNSFLSHSEKIDLLVPAWYGVDKNGLISGGPNAYVLQVARAKRIPVMPIVSNLDFNQEDFSSLVHNSKAQEEMLDRMIQEARIYGYVGYQFDFEHINYLDRDALSSMIKDAYAKIHKSGLQLSMAIVPNAPGYPGKGRFSGWMYRNWRGAYDLASLSSNIDFISLMTYALHDNWTMPGPISGWQWTLDNIDFALNAVPANKLSIGIPLFGYRWYTGEPKHNGSMPETPNLTVDDLTGEDAILIAKSFNTPIMWDTTDHTAWLWYTRDYNREWVFFTDKRSFVDRYELIEQRGLRGFSAWALGQEDPSIWDALPKHNTEH